MTPTRPWPVRGLDGKPRSSRSLSPPEASARRSCAFRRRTMATGTHGFIATLVGIAHEKGVSGYIGDGANRWPAVHRLDSAQLFRLGLEEAPAGSTLHAVADEGVPVRDIAEIIGRHLELPVVSIAPEDAGAARTSPAGRLPRRLDSPASSVL